MTQTDFDFSGSRGRIFVRCWSADEPDHVVVIAHGYGEHSGRYGHVAERLVAGGACVYVPDHHAHGRSDGERATFDDLGILVDDLHALVERVRDGLPVALVGHSMGGIVATRYAQGAGAETLDALVLSGPVIGGNPAFEALLGMDPMPEIPIDPTALSRDPSVGESYMADPLVYHGPFKRSTLAALLEAVDAVKSGPALGRLPLLWVHGERDPLAPLEVTRPVVEVIKGETFESEIYPAAMHEVFNETNRAEVLDRVAAFVARVR